MKKLILILMLFVGSFTFAQTYELPTNGSIILDSLLTTIVNKEYSGDDYRNRRKIDFYDHNIQSIMKKYYSVYEDELETAIQLNWFETVFKPILDDAILERKKFLKK